MAAPPVPVRTETTTILVKGVDLVGRILPGKQQETSLGTLVFQEEDDYRKNLCPCGVPATLACCRCGKMACPTCCKEAQTSRQLMGVVSRTLRCHPHTGKLTELRLCYPCYAELYRTNGIGSFRVVHPISGEFIPFIWVYSVPSWVPRQEPLWSEAPPSSCGKADMCREILLRGEEEGGGGASESKGD